MYHREFIAHEWNWTIPEFGLTKDDVPSIDELAALPELFPIYDGAKWSLGLEDEEINKHTKYVTKRFLGGFDDSDSDRE